MREHFEVHFNARIRATSPHSVGLSPLFLLSHGQAGHGGYPVKTLLFTLLTPLKQRKSCSDFGKFSSPFRQ